jgi:hypothetical protein
LPPYARRSKSLEVLIPILYLKGVSTGDFEQALLALLGKEAGGLSASTIGRFERSCEFPGIQPNSGPRDDSRLSCGVWDTQLGPNARM